MKKSLLGIAGFFIFALAFGAAPLRNRTLPGPPESRHPIPGEWFCV
jgi:hypothetical protein